MKRTILVLVTGSLALAPLSGCESLPGNKKEQGAVIGGLGGAAAGAALSKDNRVLGALLGGALGAGGGYLIGAQLDKSGRSSRDDAIRASERAQTSPATEADVRNSTTADLNRDGYVTMDEVVAMRRAGLSDDEMIRRLRDTGQYFELTRDQENWLRDRGVSDRVVESMRTMNQDVRRAAERRLAPESDRGSDRIGDRY